MDSITITNIVLREMAGESACAPGGRISFLALILLGLLILLVVGLVVLLAGRKRPSSPAPSVQTAPPVSPEDRQAILRKLADGELSKAEAEEQLNTLGTPIPAAMPAPPPAGGVGKGCLIALLIIPVTIILLLLAGFLFHVKAVDRERVMLDEVIRQHAERVEQMHENSRPTHFKHQ